MKKGILINLLVLLFMVAPLNSFALSGKVSYPDGSPASGAVVTFSAGEEQEPVTVSCDASGRFEINQASAENAVIKISAPDGKPFVGTNLPAALFEGSGLAVVLQPRN